MMNRVGPLPVRGLPWSMRYQEFFARKTWAVPFLYIAVALLLGLRGPALGSRWADDLVAPMSSSSAIAALSSIASGMLAFTGIAFSLGFVALQMTATSYSPRLQSIIMQKGFFANALGIFTGTFLYALVALRAVDFQGRSGVNSFAVFIALAWLLASVGTLVLLVPRVQSLTLTRVLAAIGGRCARSIAHVYPARFRAGVVPAALPDTQVELEIRNEGAPGYLASLDARALVEAARDAGALLVLPHAVGDYVARGEPLAQVRGAARPLSVHRVRSSLLVAPQREIDLDPAYGVRLLVDVAIRALSPAVNDPTTAVMVLDQLEPLLRQLAAADLDVGRIQDEQGSSRLVFPTPTWEDLLLLALLEIQQYGSESLSVQRRLGALLTALEASVPEPRREAVRRLQAHRETLVRRVFPAIDNLNEAEADDPQGLGLGRPPQPSGLAAKPAPPSH